MVSRDRFIRLIRREDAQDLLEYGLLVSLIALFALGTVRLIGDTLNRFFWESIATNFPS